MGRYCKNILLLLLLCSCKLGYSQASFIVSQFIPNGDLGPKLKKSVSYQLTFNKYSEDELWEYRFEFLYTSFKPRKDTFDTWIAEVTGSHAVLYPGVEVIRSSSMAYFSGVFNRKLISVGDASLYVGLGLYFGLAQYHYYRDIPLIRTDNDNGMDFCLGLKSDAGIKYKITPNFTAFFESAFLPSTSPGNGTHYTHFTNGLGITYFLFPDD